MVEAGVTAKPNSEGLLERDREWTASEALDLISA
jgi:hypothetical protein